MTPTETSPAAEAQAASPTRIPHVPAWMQRLLELYGPYAFGLVSLLILWLMVVAPEMKRRDDFAAQYLEASKQIAAAADAQRDIARSQTATAQAHAEIGRSQAQIAERLERILARMER